MDKFNLYNEIPFWCKMNLTVKEAAAYSGIGINRIDELTNDPNCDFVLRKGTHKMIKRKQFEKFNDTLQDI